MAPSFLSVWLKFFFLLTPFFALSVFLSMTAGMPLRRKFRLALRVIAAACAVSFSLFFFGNQIFEAFGITIDAFRIGGGALLFLTAVRLVEGAPVGPAPAPGGPGEQEEEIAVVPRAIPVTVGPGTTAALLIMGAESATWGARAVSVAALGAALLSFGAILSSASLLERLLGRRGLTILSKVTGLVLAALAAQMVFTGVRAFLVVGAG
ncbi:MAG: MarC family protein [Planctomycetes bacterium]|nr:MarC family protein [Planctomycetota bacterium]